MLRSRCPSDSHINFCVSTWISERGFHILPPYVLGLLVVLQIRGILHIPERIMRGPARDSHLAFPALPCCYMCFHKDVKGLHMFLFPFTTLLMGHISPIKHLQLAHWGSAFCLLLFWPSWQLPQFPVLTYAPFPAAVSLGFSAHRQYLYSALRKHAQYHNETFLMCSLIKNHSSQNWNGDRHNKKCARLYQPGLIIWL